MSLIDDRMARIKVEHSENWRGILDSFPWITFPADWQVQVIPPFGGATARFRVKVPGCDSPVSVYADHFDALGCYGEPYWEVYPCHGDVGRCPLADVPGLLQLIADRATDEWGD